MGAKPLQREGEVERAANTLVRGSQQSTTSLSFVNLLAAAGRNSSSSSTGEPSTPHKTVFPSSLGGRATFRNSSKLEVREAHHLVLAGNAEQRPGQVPVSRQVQQLGLRRVSGSAMSLFSSSLFSLAPPFFLECRVSFWTSDFRS